MKRIAISAFLTLCLVFSLGATALGVDNLMHFNFVLEAADSHLQQIQVEQDDVFAVNSVIRCTSIAADDAYMLHSMQTEIVYDKDMLELISAVYNTQFRDDITDVATRDFTSREGNYQRVMVTSGTGARGEKPAELIAAVLIFRAKTNGVTYITNENAAMNVESGLDVYSSEVTDMTVTISSGTPAPQTYAISITNPTGGTITSTPSGSAQAGETVTLGIALSSGYTLSQWIVRGADGILVYSGAIVSGASFVMPNQAVTVTAALNYSSGGPSDTGNTTQEITIDNTDTPLTGARSARFSDVPENHWAFSFIEYLAELGFIKGKTDELYYPSDNITRGEFVTILSRMSGEAMVGDSTPFTDVAPDAFYADAVEWAYKNGIVNGTSATTFSPNALIQRQEIAVMLVRYASYRGYSFGEVNAAKDFTDSADIADYAAEAVNSMQKANVIGGYEDGSFRPRGIATRAETAKMLALVHNAMFPDLIIE